MNSHYRRCAPLLQTALLIGLMAGIGVSASTLPEHCSLFPANNAWNTPISALPIHPRSNAWITTLGHATGFHMDFGSGTWDGGPIGIPFNVVSGTTLTWRTFDFYYPEESDPGPYPIPDPVAIEYGSDHHMLIVDADTCKLYEIYDAALDAQGWHGGSGAIWDLGANHLRPAGWTSADAAGLPILPGLVRYEEIAAGAIHHALRFTAPLTRSYIWPARHLTAGSAGVLTNTPPMGARFRLKANYPVSGFTPELQVILQAMKTYGIILADNGSPWYVSGAPDERWDNDRLHDLNVLTGSDFEAVDTACLQVAPDSAEADLSRCGVPALPRLINLSTRAQVGTGDNVLIGGFVIGGSMPHQVLIRAIGPSMASAGVSDTLANPQITLTKVTGEVVASNDNWQDDPQAGAIAAPMQPTHPNEAALLLTLQPGVPYTPMVSGVGGTTGVALVEVYDVDDANTFSRLVNLSTRARVGTGDKVMIGGFVIGGNQPKKVLIRAIGPSLASAGVADTLANPNMTLTKVTGEFVANNDNWQDGPNAAELQTLGRQPANPNESALLLVLQPNVPYTPIVEGVGGTQGVALVEVYEVP